MAKRPANRGKRPLTLRQRSETALRTASGDLAHLSMKRVRRLVHELQVRQIELELQNEALRRSQLELVKTRDRLAGYYDQAPVGYVTLDSALRIRQANVTAASLLGVERHQLVGRKFIRFVDRQSRDALQLHHLRMMEKVRQSACELSLRRADGSIFPAHLECVRCADEEGPHWVTLNCALTDISERRQTQQDMIRREAALRASESRLSYLLHSTPIVIYTANPSGDYGTNFVSENVRELTGYAASQFMEDSGFWARHIHPEDVARVFTEVGQLIERGAYRISYRYIAKNGRIHWLEDSARVVKDDQGIPKEIIGGWFEITERKLVEEELARSQKALRSLTARLDRIREKERARISREIHDELGHAMTNLKLDLAWLDRRLADRGLKERCVIRQRISDMSRRVDQHAQAVRRIATDLRPAILDSLGLLATIQWQAREFEERTGIRCRLVSSQVLPDLDSEQSSTLFRVFQEVLSNIALHSQATVAEFSLLHESGRVKLSVCDNGRGIAQAELVSPTALGLLGMRERAAALGGEVDIQGVPGQGTSVEFSIPSRCA